MTEGSISRDARSYRLTSIDMLRGLVIVIMAIDHVRDFFMDSNMQDPMAQPDVPIGLYLTRWITHFCAPVFVFLAGTSAGLMAARKSRHELAAFLAKRGLWLVFVEVAIISTAYTFSPFPGVPELGGLTLLVLQVIWAIGASMLVLAAAQYLGARACAVFGVVIILGHNRVPKYQHKLRHRVSDKFNFTAPELAVLGVLFLRGPQTVGEIRSRSARIHEFESLESVSKVLVALESDPHGPYVTTLARQEGRTEPRYAHLFCGEPDETVQAGAVSGHPSAGTRSRNRHTDHDGIHGPN